MLNPLFLHESASPRARVRLYAALHKNVTQAKTYWLFLILLGELAAHERHINRYAYELEGEGVMYSVQVFGVTVYRQANIGLAESLAAKLSYELLLFARKNNLANLLDVVETDSFIKIVEEQKWKN